MSESKDKIKLFEGKQVRHIWDEEAEKWWFSVVDICAVLTDSDYQASRKYWKVLKGRLAKEGNESVTNCYQLKMHFEAVNKLSDETVRFHWVNSYQNFKEKVRIT